MKVQPEGISAKDERELLDYLIKIVDNNYSRIGEIWNPIEMVLMGYVEHCISTRDKLKTQKTTNGEFHGLNKDKKKQEPSCQIASLKWILTELLGLLIRKNSVQKAKTRKRSTSTDKEESITSQDTHNSEEPIQKVNPVKRQTHLFEFAFGEYQKMIRAVTAKKNEEVNRLLLDVVNSNIDNHAGTFGDLEWEFVLQVSGTTVEFLSLKGNMRREDADLMFDVIHKVKNMYLNKLSESNLRHFICICNR